MANFCTRLVTRTLGLVPTVQPLISPMFIPLEARGNEAGSRGDSKYGDNVNHLTSQEISVTSAPISTHSPQTNSPSEILTQKSATTDNINAISVPVTSARISPHSPQTNSPSEILTQKSATTDNVNAISVPVTSARISPHSPQTNSPSEILTQKSATTVGDNLNLRSQPLPVTSAPISLHSPQTKAPGEIVTQKLAATGGDTETVISTPSQLPKVSENIQPLIDEITPILPQTRLAENQLTTTQDVMVNVSPSKKILVTNEQTILPENSDLSVNIQHLPTPEIQTLDKVVSREKPHKLREVTAASTDFSLPSSDSSIQHPKFSEVVPVIRHFTQPTPSKIEPPVKVDTNQPLNADKFTVIEKSNSGEKNTLQPTPVKPIAQKSVSPQNQQQQILTPEITSQLQVSGSHRTFEVETTVKTNSEMPQETGTNSKSAIATRHPQTRSLSQRFFIERSHPFLNRSINPKYQQSSAKQNRDETLTLTSQNPHTLSASASLRATNYPANMQRQQDEKAGDLLAREQGEKSPTRGSHGVGRVPQLVPLRGSKLRVGEASPSGEASGVEVSTKGAREQGSFHPQGVLAERNEVRFVPLVAPLPLPPASYQEQPQTLASPPTINITIGRIEVRGVNQSTSPAPGPKPVSRSPALSLDSYLQQRNGSQR